MKGNRVVALTAALSILGSSAAFAFGSNVDVDPHQYSYERERTAEEWARLRDNTIEWDEIQDLVREYNPTVSNLWITYRENDHNGAYNIDYSEALSAIEDSYETSVTLAGDDAVQQAIADMQYQINSSRTTIDSSAQSTDSQAAKLQVMQSEKTVAESAKKSIITMYTTQIQKELAEKTAVYQQSQYEQTERKKAVGNATQLDVLSAKETVDSANLSVKSTADNLEKLTQLLRVSLGWTYDSTPEICAVPMPSEEDLNALNLDTDTNLALQNNYAIAITERKIAVSETDTQINSLTLQLNNQKESVRSDMISRYQALQQARNSLLQAQLVEQNAQASLDKVQRSYSVGGASARDLESAQYALDSASASTKIAEYTLADEYYDYLAGRDGIASAS